MFKLFLLWSALICFAIALRPASVLGAGATPSASQGGVYWQVTAPNAGVSLRVTGPNGFVFEQTFASGQAPALVPQGGVLADGAYTYEMVFAPVVSPEARAKAQANRDNGGEGSLGTGSVESGTFRVVQGQVLLPQANVTEPSKRSSLSLGRSFAPDDFVIADDLITQGSACVGIDCVNGEDFGFDTIRVKENNTRIQFDDTSVTAGFATNNWQIRANSSASGGPSFLGFVDQGATGNSETGTIVFEVDAGAPANSLKVASTGRVGLRTAAPVLDLHINTGNTPGIRLEQNNSSGFTAQTWDVAGNEAGFFIRDVTGGSALSFRIRPGAPSSSIDIATSGNVGFGTSDPDDGDGLAERFIDVKSPSNGDARVVVDSGDGAGRFGEFLFQRNNVNKWSFGDENNRFYFYNYIPGGGQGYVMGIDNATSNVTIFKNLTVNGTFSNPSSREIKNLLSGMDGSAILAKLSSLPLFTWSYKTDESVRHFGPVAEDFYERFRLGLDEKHISPNDMAGVALAATQALNKIVEEKDAEIRALKAQLSPLQERLDRLEERLNRAPEQTQAK